MRTTILKTLSLIAITWSGDLQAMDTEDKFETTIRRNASVAITWSGDLQAMDTEDKFETTIRNASQNPVAVGIYVCDSTLKGFLKRIKLLPAEVTQDQKTIISNQRIGFVTVQVGDVTKYNDLTNLASEITVSSKEDVGIDLKPQPDEVPAELLSTVSYTKFDLAGKANELIQSWEAMTAEQRKTPWDVIPSCLHALDISPVFSSRHAKCFTYGMKQYALKKWQETNGSVYITEDEIRAAEKKLLDAGVPITLCN